jgi:hypothetical protein
MQILDSDKWKAAQGIWFIPAMGAGIDTITKSPIWETVWQVAWGVDAILNYLPEPIKSLVVPAAWVLSAWLLSNQVMNDLWIDNKLIKYWVNSAAMLGWYFAWTAAAPYLAVWAAWYWAWKYGWKYWKEFLKRWVWALWGATWWAVAWWVRSTWKWLEWKQKLNPQF